MTTEERVLDENTLVEVESVGVGSVGYQPDYNPLIRRRWDKPGVKKKVKLGELQEVISSTAGYNLFLHHLLIKDVEVRKYLDLPIEEGLLYSDADLDKLLKKTVTELKEALETLPDEFKRRLAEKAAATKIDSVPKIKAIKDATGIDVYKLIEQIEEQKNPKAT